MSKVIEVVASGSGTLTQMHPTFKDGALFNTPSYLSPRETRMKTEAKTVAEKGKKTVWHTGETPPCLSQGSGFEVG